MNGQPVERKDTGTGMEKEVEIFATSITNKTNSTHVRALSQFLLCIFLLSPAEIAWSRVIKQLCKSDRGCPVIEISSF
jgi:hypothetical protein